MYKRFFRYTVLSLLLCLIFSITSFATSTPGVPVSDLDMQIVNPDTMRDGELTTETLFGLMYLDEDNDIIEHYFSGTASAYIIEALFDGSGNEIGCLVQITDPGVFELDYWVENSNNEFSVPITYSLTVLEANDFQVIEGSFTAQNNSFTYNISIDFTNMNSAAICLVKTGYIDARVTIYNENGSQVGVRATGAKQPKGFLIINKPNSNAGVTNYTLVVTPDNYSNKLSTYRIMYGDSIFAERMMSGVENAVLLDRYYHAQSNFIQLPYTPNQEETYYKFRLSSANDIATVLTYTSNIRFRIEDVNTGFEWYTSEGDTDAQKTQHTGGWSKVEKHKLDNIPVGQEYYLIVFNRAPSNNSALVQTNITSAVGYPIMGAGTASINPGTTITAPTSGFSSNTFTVNTSSSIPFTAQVQTISVQSVTMSKVPYWRVIAPGRTAWKNSAMGNSSIDMSYSHDSSTNAYLVGKLTPSSWSVGFQASSSSGAQTITPRYSVTYFYELGD